jgi:dolichyl-phosphate-mannose--protein O-mannosyl transferase
LRLFFLSGTIAPCQTEEGLAPFLPAFRVWSRQVLAQYPVVGIFEHMTLDAFGIGNVLIQIGVPWFYAGRSNLWQKKSTPRHGYVPSLFLMYLIDKDKKNSTCFLMYCPSTISPGVATTPESCGRWELLCTIITNYSATSSF